MYDTAKWGKLKESHVNLALAGLVTVLDCSDETLGEATRLLQRDPPKGTKADAKLVYDGWMTRRNNTSLEGCDYVVLRLKFPSTIQGFSLDTRGIRKSDLPRRVKLEALVSDQNEWRVLLEPIGLDFDSENNFICIKEALVVYNQVKLSIFKDGGLARLRIFGTVKRPPITPIQEDPIDLASVGNGGCIVEASTCESGSHRHIFMPEDGENIHDGWLTPRSQTNDNEEYVLIAFARPAIVSYMDLYTNVYEGMRPQSFQLYGSINQNCWDAIGAGMITLPNLRVELPLTDQFYTHILVVFYPGGGIMRLRLMGWLCSPNEDGLTPAQQRRNARHKLDRGIRVVNKYHMDYNNDLNHPTNTREAVNLYSYLLIASELTFSGMAFNHLALLRLIVHLNGSRQLDLTRLINALRAERPLLTSSVGIAFLKTIPRRMKEDTSQKDDYNVPPLHESAHSYFQTIFKVVNNELRDIDITTSSILHIIRTLNPDNPSKLTLPTQLDFMLSPAFASRRMLPSSTTRSIAKPSCITLKPLH
ncbi:hypothetical protein L0F63_000582 [Massospora cicadina]|nr:hypothetical protein L0F63_000582 [Massospora cicadina]